MVKLPLLETLASCFTHYKSFPSALKCMRDQNIRISAGRALILVQSTEILHVQNVPPIMQACNELETFFRKVTTVRTDFLRLYLGYRFSDNNKHLVNFARGTHELSTSPTWNLYLHQSNAPVSSTAALHTFMAFSCSALRVVSLPVTQVGWLIHTFNSTGCAFTMRDTQTPTLFAGNRSNLNRTCYRFLLIRFTVNGDTQPLKPC